ncbi:shufflon system plasmid conjugative transfer pilus tip adhesin PilV [Pseudomonas aeruginosa]|uniref:shufflon system plasmid conjugative transfer pilus tip adhesin PilV n=1 Tax=Pseudomonas aeruginosa TaxID=287 RepID=UPI001E2B3514|nr:shufflon system plasmid conjugative transfer pilus tip adhesin PilV [Pseudomonas aeruginosa]MCC9290097.1 shufflon system plasmid conjugative transfer pilus tip adhesin PilV [Pseudomonas aeruginosa]UVN19099.1 Type IV B pilus protein [Pseudomonas aeruginosa]
MKARGRVLRGARKQQGFAAIELIVVLILVISALWIGAQAMFHHADNMAAQTTADHQKFISDAAAAYIKDNYAALVAAAGPTTPASITTTMLKNTAYLEASVADLNSFGHAYRVLAIVPTPYKLQTLVLTTGGETISETSIRRIAKQVRARGGYVSYVDTSRVEGSFGAWGVPLASYRVSPGPGHLATALFYDDGALTNDYLYPNSVAGHPEVNRMNTSIDMGGNNLNYTGTVNATTANITGIAAVAGNATVGGTIKAQTADITGESYTGAWFRTRGDSGSYNEKCVGGWYMCDATWVRSYAIKNVYTAGEMRGAKLTSEGRTDVGQYLQLYGVATEAAGCSPNGHVGRNAAALTLTCQSGVCFRMYQPSYVLTRNSYVINQPGANAYATCGCEPAKETGSYQWSLSCRNRACMSYGIIAGHVQEYVVPQDAAALTCI